MAFRLQSSPDIRKNLVALSSLQEEINLQEGLIEVEVDWVTPLSVVALSRMQSAHRRFEVTGRSSSYLDTIGFPFGSSQPFCDGVEGKSYIPLFRADLSSGRTGFSETFGRYTDFVCSRVVEKERQDHYRALSWAFDELATNIEEHSGGDSAWMLVQAYEKRRELEICIADNGVGFFERYQRDISVNLAKPESHLQAMRLALGGTSTKGTTDRGYGLRKSLAMFASKAFEGQVVLVSGNACYYKRSSAEGIQTSLSTEFSGVLVAAKFKLPDEHLDVYRYVE